ncbi:MAG: pimeloyl-ACP methyl ester carboxylesterase [Desulforhopalus sp.]
MFENYPFTSHFHDLNGLKLHYIDEGKGPVIVMIHGNPTWSFYYRNLIHKLKKNYRVVAIDHIGCGLSDKPQKYDYTLSQHIDNVLSVIGALNIDRFSLVLHDWGGAIGMGVAGRSPDKVDKIVVMNTAAFRSSRIPFRIRLCRIPLLGEVLVRLFNGFAWPATFMAVRNTMNDKVKNGYLAPYNSWKNRIATHRFVLDIPLSEDHPSYHTLVEVEAGLDEIKKLGVPLLIVWGGKDFCFNDSFYNEWKERFPDAESTYYADAGHYVLEDKKDEVNERIATFFLK